MKKLSILIALVCLSFGAFAQVSTVIVFEGNWKPTRPADRPNNLTITVTYYLTNGQVFGTSSRFFNDITDFDNAQLYFPGTPQEALTIASTKIELAFYDRYCGIGQNFPSIPNLVRFPSDFVGPWWYTVTKNKYDN